jgi:phosphatidylglycerophosphatase A
MLSSRVIWMRALVIFFATGIYTGYSPYASGTAGSVVGMILSWFVFMPLWKRSPALCLVIFAIAFVIACWISDEAERIFEEHDSSKIVIDEVLGMVFTMFGNPMTWPYMLAGFFLFRMFDIFKPFPAGYVDAHIRNGIGVMVDDLAAAVYANIVLQIAARILH